MHAAIADTGALVALLDRAERHHGWAAQRIREMEVPMLICEPVLTEAMHLLAHLRRAQDELFGLLENGALKISFCVEDHVPALRALHRKYQDKPMSLADACIYGWLNSMTSTPCSRSILIFSSIANMAASPFHLFAQSRHHQDNRQIVPPYGP